MATITVKGKLIKAVSQSKTFNGVKGRLKTYLSLADVNLSDKQKEVLKNAYKECGKKYTPTWITDFNHFVNVSTIYEVPTKNNVNGREYDDILEVEDDMPTHGSLVTMSLNIKNGAVYPKAIVIYTEGEEYDPFNDIENAENGDLEEDELPFK